jgi:hypothetical protein
MTSKWILTTAICAALSVAGLGLAQTPSTSTAAQAKSSTKTRVTKATPAPNAQEIADAKAKGMVWVNSSTKVYHKDGQFYGNTKHGKFMTEDEAKASGFKAAKEPSAKKTKATSKS